MNWSSRFLSATRRVHQATAKQSFASYYYKTELMSKLAYVVYKLTFPNGKIYIGMDIGGSGHSLRYFGSWNNDLVEMDFEPAALRDFTLRKEILFESTDKSEVRKAEIRLISQHNSNDPEIGYNRTPRTH